MDYKATSETEGNTMCQEYGGCGEANSGRPRKTWNEVIHKDLRDNDLNRETTRDQAAWRAAIR